MKLIIILLALFPSFVFASHWELASTSPNSTTWVDVSSLSKKGNYRTVWLRWNFHDPQTTDDYTKTPYKSVKSMTYYDCSNKSSLEVQSVLYSGEFGSGENVKTYLYKFNPENMSSVVPDTTGEETLNYVCSRKIKNK